jgi:hypothetical protein
MPDHGWHSSLCLFEHHTRRPDHGWHSSLCLAAYSAFALVHNPTLICFALQRKAKHARLKWGTIKSKEESLSATLRKEL